MLAMGLVTVSVFAFLLVFGAAAALGLYAALRRSGIVGGDATAPSTASEPDVIEGEFVVIEQREERIREEKI